MTNLGYERSVFNWLSDVPTRKWVLFAAGGILTVSCGGYLIYRHLKEHNRKSSAPSDFPADPVHANTSPSSRPIHADASPPAGSACKRGGYDKLSDVTRIKEEGNGLFRNKEYEAALKSYEEAIKICPLEQKLDLAALYQNRAAVYEKLNQDKNVYDECTKALQLNPRYFKALIRRGNICMKLNNWKQAAHDFMKCCILENFARDETARKADEALKTLTRHMAQDYVKQRSLENKPKPLSKTVVRATLKSFGCDPIMAELCSAVEKVAKKSRATVVTNGQAINGEIIEGYTGNYTNVLQLIGDQRFDEVIDACSLDVADDRLSPRLVECLLIRSLFYNMSGALEKSRSDLSRVMQLLNQSSDGANLQGGDSSLKCTTHLLYGFLEHLAGNIDEAMNHLLNAENLCPENSAIFSLRGQIRSLNGAELQVVLSDFTKAVDLRPDFLQYRIQMLAHQAKIINEQQNAMLLPAVMAQIQELVSANPDSIDANLFYSQIMLEMDRTEIAITHLDRVLQLDPRNAEAVAQKALIDMTNGNVEKGVQSLNLALEIDPYCLMALETLAQYHSKRSDLPRMMECYDKVFQVARSEVEVAHFMNMREATLINMQMAEELLL